MSIQNINPIVWNIPYGIKANCYLFALAPLEGIGGYTNRSYKSTPGMKCSKFKTKHIDFNSCSEIIERVKCDNPVFVEKIPTKLRHDNFSYKNHVICVLLSHENNKEDFHFLRRVPFSSVLRSYEQFNIPHQTKVQFEILKQLHPRPKYIWCHQRGWSIGGPVIHDADDKIILDPLKANFDYKRLNYSKICGFMKVRTRKATVDSTHNRTYKTSTKFKRTLKKKHVHEDKTIKYENDRYKIKFDDLLRHIH